MKKAEEIVHHEGWGLTHNEDGNPIKGLATWGFRAIDGREGFQLLPDRQASKGAEHNLERLVRVLNEGLLEKTLIEASRLPRADKRVCLLGDGPVHFWVRRYGDYLYGTATLQEKETPPVSVLE